MDVFSYPEPALDSFAGPVRLVDPATFRADAVRVGGVGRDTAAGGRARDGTGAAAGSASLGAVASSGTAVLAPPAHLRVLIVEDDDDTRELLAIWFAGEHTTVLAVRSSDEALEVTREEPVDLAVVDLALPDGMNGWELIDHLNLHHSDTMIAVCSTLDPTDYPAAYAQLPKPFTRQNVDALMHRLGGRWDGKSVPAVTLIAHAVVAAAAKAARAAQTARDTTALAANLAAQGVADNATREAFAVQRRADVSAAKLAEAASTAAALVAAAAAPGTERQSALATLSVAAAVTAAATAAAQDTAAAAAWVAEAVRVAAAGIASTVSAAAAAAEHEVDVAATTLQATATATARRAATATAWSDESGSGRG